MNQKRFSLGRFAVNNGLLGALVLMVIFFSIASKYFLYFANFRNILVQISIMSLIAVPMTMVIVSAQIDLSIGTVVGLMGSVMGFLMVKSGWNFWAAAAIAVPAGLLIGWFNGYVSIALRIPTFIVTLATSTSMGGVALLLTQGYPISGFPDSFSFWGQGYLGPVPVPVIFMVVVYAIGFWVMSSTAFGRRVYAVGGNEEASRLSGIEVNKVKIAVMVACSGVAAVSGILLASRMTSGIANAGDPYMLDVIAAVIIGGANLNGGSGTIIGTFFGILFMGILRNGLVIMGVDAFVTYIVQGAVVLFAVALNTFKDIAAARGR
jgi:ribose/xylose/arabinose/galactoside ABC-type transport system permease subunit